MINENPNNDFHWKSELDELECLAGETFKKEAAWRKLYLRMQKKPRNNKSLWYWAAAASLIIALSIPWFISKKNTNTLAKVNPKQQQVQSPVFDFLPAKNNDSIADISSTPLQKKTRVSSIENHKKLLTSLVDRLTTVENIAIQSNKEITEPTIINSGLAPVDTQRIIAAVLPANKKLRVVYINELGEPGEQTVMVRKTETHSFQLKLANQEVFETPAAGSKTIGFTIFKTKTSTN